VVLRSEVALAESDEAAMSTDVIEGDFSVASTTTTGEMIGSVGSTFSASGARYEWMLISRGARSFFSLIVMTIFSRSSGVICLSRPLLRHEPESCRWILGLAIASGAEVELVSEASNSTASSSAVSTLPERSGISALYRPSDVLDAIEIAGVVEFAARGSQQKVSRFHNLQLRFSSLRPSSNEPAHREKTSTLLDHDRPPYHNRLTYLSTC
jgi:hypothetical protein